MWAEERGQGWGQLHFLSSSRGLNGHNRGDRLEAHERSPTGACPDTGSGRKVGKAPPDEGQREKREAGGDCVGCIREPHNVAARPGAQTPNHVAQSEASASFWAPAVAATHRQQNSSAPIWGHPGGVRTLGKGRCWGQETEMGQESRAS